MGRQRLRPDDRPRVAQWGDVHRRGGGPLPQPRPAERGEPPRLSSPIAVAASSFVGSGAALTNQNAANLTGTLAVARIPDLDAAKVTTGTLDAARIPDLDAAKITTGTLDNARTSGTNLNTPSTLVLRDGLGNFSAGTITANLNGHAATATTATNATQLNGQPASFYTNAANLTGTLAVARIPDLDAAKITTGTLGDARLSSNIPRLNASNNFTGSQQTFSGTSGINISRGIIQKGGSPLTATDDMGLYSQTNGTWMRFVTTNAPFQWFSDGGIGGPTPRMTLNPNGNLAVTGSLSKGGGSFKIDHPLDPENKYLYHSFVESPDMMNVYNGNVTTDAQGRATITLPDYFEALNRDFRYQLTVIDEDSFALVRVSRKIAGNTFAIASSEPGVEVSWQVTGIRKDAWAEQNRIPNSVDKSPVEKGRYLHPEAFGKPASQGVLAVPTLPDTQASKRE